MEQSGYIQTEIDPRDYGICMAYDDDPDLILPDVFITSFQPPYEKQLCGNCVAQSLANIMEVIYYNKMQRHVDFSVGFIYGNRNSNESKSEGMTGYLACDHLVSDGDIKAEIFENPGSAPSIIKKVDQFKEENPNWQDYAYVPVSYIRTRSKEEAKKFIYKYNIPVMATCKTSDFYWGDGYHAMALYGWEDDTAIMQNSWGENHSRKIVELDFDKIIDYWLIMPYDLAQFTDLEDIHWAYNDILRCAEDGIVQGYPDGSFRPDEKMTRAEFCSIVYRYLHK